MGGFDVGPFRPTSPLQAVLPAQTILRVIVYIVRRVTSVCVFLVYIIMVFNNFFHQGLFIYQFHSGYRRWTEGHANLNFIIIVNLLIFIFLIVILVVLSRFHYKRVFCVFL